MNNTRAQIVGTIGPASSEKGVLQEMVSLGLDVVRLNMSWGTFSEHENYISTIREIIKLLGKNIPIIIDLPGPRIQTGGTHAFDNCSVDVLTEKDKEIVEFGVRMGVEYFAVSFVGCESDIQNVKILVSEKGGQQKIIAKIERKIAVQNIDSLIRVSDAIMIARGDLGNEVAIQEIPFIEKEIIEKCNLISKSVIVATQMMLSMTDNPYPTRAEVTDVAYSILLGSDAVMLSEESARGKYPMEAVKIMNDIIKEAENHLPKNKKYNLL
jgi:pyruvate kinase